MADYWKSNARKYCEFCKCWIADNKISVSLHEDGRRHKDNVSKKISAIHKKSAAERKEQKKIDQQMARMEKTAMAAYLKDMENNADLTSQIINEKLAEANRSRNTITTTSAPDKNVAVEGSSDQKKKRVWQEAKSEKGYTYYWNTETNDTSWDPPEEGYVSFAELQVKKTPQKHNFKPPKPPKGKNKNKKFKPRNDDGNQEAEQPLPEYGPIFVGNPYGKWVTVKDAPPVDLQLPESKSTVVAPVIATPVEKVFKEKTVTLVKEEDEGPADINFKKRKINMNAKRNTRQRLDDD